MSYEQYVRYKQQLRSITVEFLKVANTASNDQLEIVLARFADRVSDEPEAAFEEKYKGFLISNLLELRSAGEVQRLQKHLASQTKHIDWAEYYRRMSALRQKLPLLKKVFGEPTPDFCVTDLMDAEVLINQVSDFPIVPNEQRPADRTPEEYTPTRDEIKRLTYQG